jgi:hypothetical protein
LLKFDFFLNDGVQLVGDLGEFGSLKNAFVRQLPDDLYTGAGQRDDGAEF